MNAEAEQRRLSRFIRERKDDIVRAWVEAVSLLPRAQHLDQPAMIDHVPDVLEAIAHYADEIGAGQLAKLPADAAQQHAIARLGDGFDLGDVAAELSALRDCIIRLWAAQEDPHHAMQHRVLGRAIDTAVNSSIERYTKARDRTVEALDQISNAALESPSLGEFLRRLLRVLVDTTPAIESCAVLLREGDVLRPTAAIGVDAQGPAQQVGTGFAGTIAQTRAPLELHDAPDGLRTQYGLPLVEGSDVIGVAHIGSRSTPEFSKQDKLLFATMCTRATMAICQHLLREELRTLADNIPQHAWMADAGGRPYWVNKRWTDYTGRGPSTAEEAVQDPAHRTRVAASWARAIASGESWQETFPLRGKDGRDRWFLARAMPVRDDSGEIVRWFGTNTDVTEQRFLDEATRELGTSLDYVVTLERVANLAVPELADACVIELVESDGEVHRIASAGAPSGLEVRIVAPLVARGRTLGSLTLACARASRAYGGADVEMAHELGRRAGLAVDNARLYEASQRAIRTREEVLAIVSHDLRSPLAAIDLAASNLLHEGGATPRSRKLLEVTRRSVDRMEHLINDLLDMATIEADGLSLDLRAYDPATLVDAVVEAHTPLAAERDISILTEVETQDAQVRCDRDRIEQVLGNLLGNAKKYCRPGDVIFVRASLVDGEARFSVADTGPGIAPDELAHVFQRYWAAKRHGQKQGTGLGLYICKGIIEAHKGRIWAESQVGQGSTFSFTLPLAERP